MGGTNVGGGGGFIAESRTEVKPAAPSLSDKFKRSNYRAAMVSDYVLQVNAAYYDCYYDFMARTMFTSTGHGVAATPFSQMDRETVVEFRDELVRQGGAPPAWPPEAAAPQTPANELKL